MSYNAKNLAYEAKEPAFLQRLRGQYGTAVGGLERPISQRPRRPRDDNDDDAPTYVDAESNEVISKEEYAAMVGSSDNQADPEKDDEGEEKTGGKAVRDEANTKQEKEAPLTSKQNLAEIGGPRKRKQARVIGEDVQEAEREDTRSKDSAPRKPKQKKKKIKLSFEE
ncbi:hypothetical protein ARAM_000442 [Aspergillus rambellii]|uniref:DUF4604 domain-containing protein n=1 Tax=Aspergillus rambellii TaxID=308745 RepID=A0A0F8V6F5_9EURO|nr:hypothetical protein ARAM_000442 [Aspergillus rambellii]